MQRHELEILKLGQRVRNAVQNAVESLGGRVTVGDVAGRAGIKIEEAEEALNALAADAGGAIEVSTRSFSHCKRKFYRQYALLYMFVTTVRNSMST